MKFITLLFSLLILLCFEKKSSAQYQYVSPVPGSTYHHPETNIILKNGGLIDRGSLSPSLLTVTGSLSGEHACRIVLSTDGKTIVIYPLNEFTEGEKVQVHVADGFRKLDGGIISGTDFQFDIRPAYSHGDRESIRLAYDYARNMEWQDAGIKDGEKDGTVRDLCSMPAYTITATGGELVQDVFYYNFRGGDGCFGKSIISNEGDSLYGTFDSERGIGFTINKNGYLTYYNYVDSCFDMMDSSYNVVKQFFMGNGYRADEHEFLVFPDGQSLMMCYDTHPNLDLSYLGGLDTVDVIGCVVQKLDADQNVIFEWRTWDHMVYADAIAWAYDDIAQGNPVFDWIHANSMELDADGNLLLSSRHLCEITKIDFSTGEMLWRMGGDNNQFTFVNDPDPSHFSGQHDFRRLPNGNYTMFNNGNNVTPNVSSAKEYQLDQVNKVATMIWKYKHPMVGTANVFGPAMGSVQRLSNGNTFINWGLLSSNIPQVPRFSEVDSAGNIVWEFNFDGEYYIVYRAHKFDWNRCAPVMDSMFQLVYISADSAVLSWNAPNFNSSYIFQYKLVASTGWISIPVASNTVSLSNLQPDSTYAWRVQSICSSIQDSSAYSGIDTFNTLSTPSVFSFGEPVAVSMYPNPATNNLIIEFGMMHATNATLYLSDVLGGLRLTKSVRAAQGLNQVLLNVEHLPAGIYLATINCQYFSYRKQLEIR